MNKRILLALSLSAGLASSLAASAVGGSCQINSGAYVGIGVGMANLNGKSQFQHVQSDGVPPIRLQMNIAQSKFSAAATLFGGYGARFGGFWTAAELSYQIDMLRFNNSKETFITAGATQDQTLKISSTGGAFGAAVHLGLLPSNNCIAYAILGIETRRFKVEYEHGNKAAIPATVNKSYRSTAFTPGLGVRFACSKNLSVRGEYKYAMYPNKTVASEDTADAAVANRKHTVNIKHSPAIHSVNLGLVYNF